MLKNIVFIAFVGFVWMSIEGCRTCKPAKSSTSADTKPATTPQSAAPTKVEAPSAPQTGSPAWAMLKQGAMGSSEKEQNFVITSQAEWEKVWKETNARFEPTPAIPAVDFSKKWVVACMAGGKPQGGHSVVIQKVSATADAVTIAVLQTSPGKNCMNADVLTFPYFFATIDHYTQAKTLFDVKKESKDCGN